MDTQSSNKAAVADACARPLKEKVYFTMASMRAMDRDTIEEIMNRFSVNRHSLSEQLLDLKQPNTVELGQRLQEEAIGNYDGNPQEGYALWLTGAWLESVKQTSPEEYEIHYLLNALNPEQFSVGTENRTPLQGRSILQRAVLSASKTGWWVSGKGVYDFVQRYVQGWLSIRDVMVSVVKTNKSDR